MEIVNAPSGDLIKDSDTQNFVTDVIETSQQVPVIVDFWAPWCGPCKQLGPALEKAVLAAGGAVRMVKINVDENQQLAAQLRVQSIPMVFAFKDGRPVDGFQGALPESQVKEFIARLGGDAGPSPTEELLEAAEAAFGEGDYVNAEAAYRQILSMEPDNWTAVGGLIQCRIKAGDTATARQAFDSLDEETREKPELAGAKAALQLAEQMNEAGDVTELRAKVEAEPGDHQARYDLAMALVAAGQNEAAASELLEIVRRDRSWNDAAARQQLITLFDAWGPADPLTVATRKSLSSILFS